MSPLTLAPTVVIRAARGSDGPALERLATLDSQRLPAGPMLVAESDGEIRAAYSVDEGRAIADPFVPTAGLVDLLKTRSACRALAAQTRAAGLEELDEAGRRHERVGDRPALVHRVGRADLAVALGDEQRAEQRTRAVERRETAQVVEVGRRGDADHDGAFAGGDLRGVRHRSIVTATIHEHK